MSELARGPMRRYTHERYCVSCNRYKPPGGPAVHPWKCVDCRKAIAERKAIKAGQEEFIRRQGAKQ